VRRFKPSSREPIFNVPGVILAMIGLTVAVHAVRTWLPDEEDSWWTLALAFIPARYIASTPALPGGLASSVLSPFTHMLVHADWTHLGLNAVWLLVFGAIVARRLGNIRVIVFTCLTGLAGAAAFLLVHWGALLPVVGASGAVSGLMGAAIRLLHAVLRTGGVRDIAILANSVPLASVRETLRDRQVMTIVAVTLITNLALGATGNLLTPGSGGIAWEAHLGGFALGLLGFGWFDPGPRVSTPEQAPVDDGSTEPMA
jgi:membrane associated rhomboid family serine protease